MKCVVVNKAFNQVVEMKTMKCGVVNKAFNQVAEEQTKIKQVKRQLKAIGCGSEHADQTADALG